MAFIQILALLINFVVIKAGTEVGPEETLRAVDSHVHFDVYASAIAKAHYNPWYCNYFKEPGFKCTDCGTALHCFPGNFALLIQCNGRLPYCSNGYCSSTKAERCVENPSKFKLPAGEINKLKEPNNDNITDVVNKNENIATTHVRKEKRGDIFNKAKGK